VKHRAGAAPPTALSFLRDELARLDEDGLLRSPASLDEEGGLGFCSNDYLGLAARPALGGAPAGAGASRLIAGNTREHEALEGAVSDWLRTEAALVFTSGYAANVGLVSALARPGDLLVSDALNHASIIDGARLSRARVEVVPHGDLDAIDRVLGARAEARAWVITESYFSMDADGPDLVALRRLCDARGAALLVDEAHAIGALGPEGRGLCAKAGIAPDALIGTFGKALGGGGAFVAGCAALRLWLWNRARSFVFSTGLSPVVAEANTDAVRRVRNDEALRTTLAARAHQLRSGLEALGIAPLGFGHIVPWVVGEPSAAVRMARFLRTRGIVAQAIRPPSVPVGTSRLRLTVRATHSEADVCAILTAIEEALRCGA
jgi:8-amino-7-oxononanoate synthase